MFIKEKIRTPKFMRRANQKEVREVNDLYFI